MSNLNWYALDPVDLLLMREAKPFSPGDGSWAKGQFPPLPTTVFQAMRSVTPWRDNQSTRTKRDLNFVGPFLLYAPPDKAPSLWLATPQDLVAVRTFNHSSETDPDNLEEGDLTDIAEQWERTARFQPLDAEHPGWKHLGFDPDFFPEDELVPMVPPHYLNDDSSQAAGEDRNKYLLNLISKKKREGIAGRPKPWIRADALIQYLKGEVLEKLVLEEEATVADCFHEDPWCTQVLPHIKVQPGTRQVAEEEGYFTEVAIRMSPHWHLVAGISAELEAKVVRLGGEGHRALVSKMSEPPPCWETLQDFCLPKHADQTAYVLTPGLAEREQEHYGLVPEHWKSTLRSCVGDRALLWGGMSVFRKTSTEEGKEELKQSTAFQPQRAFVPPGTVYRFRAGHLPEDCQSATAPVKLLPSVDQNWKKTLDTLNYGLLLWGQ